ncbi:hypothetical protein A3731_13565 [Roseovarius sp. HI0049]|nr:hypothetical protein A3731_13565 [Roseovarius sp. HI0049]
MTLLNAISLAVMTLLFLLWVGLMARMLLRLTRRSMDRLNQTGGGYFTWMGHSLHSFGNFAISAADKAERRRLLLVTALLFASIVVRPILFAAGN